MLALVAGIEGAKAQTAEQDSCRLEGTALLCTGEAPDGGQTSNETVDTVIVRDMTGDVGSFGIAVVNEAGLDVTVDADFGEFGIVLDPPSGEQSRTFGGFNIDTEGAISGTFRGDITGQTQADFTNDGGINYSNFGAFGLDADRAIDFTIVGDIDVSRPVLTGQGSDTVDVSSGRFAALRAESFPDDGEPFDVTLDVTGDISLDGTLRNVLVESGEGVRARARSVQFLDALSEDHGILAQGNGDLLLTLRGDIAVSGGGGRIEARTDGNTSAAGANSRQVRGIYAPAFDAIAGEPADNLPEFRNVTIGMVGDITLSADPLSVSAQATTFEGAPSQPWAYALGNRPGSGGSSAGIEVEAEERIDIRLAGDITVTGGDMTLEALAPLGEFGARMLIEGGAPNVAGVDLTVGSFGDGRLDFDHEGAIDLRAGTTFLNGRGEQVARRNSLDDELPSITPSLGVRVRGAQALGASFSFGDMQSTIRFDSPITVTGGAVEAQLDVRDIRIQVLGGSAFALSISPIGDYTYVQDVDVTAIGGDTSLALEDADIFGDVSGGLGTGVFLAGIGTNDYELPSERTVTARGGDLSADFGAGNDAIEFRGGGARGVVLSNSNAIDGSADGAQILIAGRILAEGGSAAGTGDGFMTGGSATGLQISSGQQLANVSISGTIEATGGTGREEDGSAQGLFITNNYDASVTGTIHAIGGGDTTGIDAFFTDGSTLTIDGAEVLAATTGGDGRTGFGVNAIGASGAADIRIVNAGVVRAQGTGGNGVYVTGTVADRETGETRPANGSILLEEGSAIIAEDGIGIIDPGIARTFVSSFDDGFLVFEFDVENEITADIAGIVTGGSGTAIDMNSGADTLVLRATGEITGDVLMGSGGDNVTTESGGSITGNVLLGEGDDSATIAAGTIVTGDFDAGDGDDIVSIADGHAIAGLISLGAGEDTFVLQAATSTVAVDGGEGTDFALLESDRTIAIDLDSYTSLTSVEGFAQDGSGTFTIADAGSSFSLYDLRGGTLFVNADQGGTSFTIGANGLIGGTGTLGGLVVSGGTVAPGNSIGTLTIVGDLSLDANSTMAVEVDDAGNADRLVVIGSVALGGATLDVTEIGDFNGSDPFNYVIIDNDAADPVDGEFGAVENDFAFLDAMITYDAGDGNDVELTLTPTGSAPPPSPPPPPPPSPPTSGTGLFPKSATTFNQTQAATALDNLDRTQTDADDVYMAVLFSTTPEALRAFDTASGEVYAAQLAGSTRQAAAQTFALLSRSRAFENDGFGVWGGISTGTSSLDSDGNAAFSQTDGFAANFGIDYRGQDDGWALGLSVGYVERDVDIAQRQSGSEGDGFRLGGYSRIGDNAHGVTISAAATYREMEARTQRDIEIASLRRTASANIDQQSFGLAAEARYGFGVGTGITIGPVVSVFHASGEIAEFEEAGAGAVNLNSEGGDFARTRAGLGLFGNVASDGVRFDASVQYVDGSSEFAVLDLVMEGAGAAPFAVRSAAEDGGGVLIGLAADLDLGTNLTLSADLRSLVQKELEEYSGSITIGWQF